MTLRDELEALINQGPVASGLDNVGTYMAKCAMFINHHGPALLNALRRTDPSEHVRYLEEVEDTTDIEPRLHSYDATGRKESIYVIWPGGDRHYYIREDLIQRPATAGQSSACSICFGNGFDVAGRPCPFAPHQYK